MFPCWYKKQKTIAATCFIKRLRQKETYFLSHPVSLLHNRFCHRPFSKPIPGFFPKPFWGCSKQPIGHPPSIVHGCPRKGPWPCGNSGKWMCCSGPLLFHQGQQVRANLGQLGIYTGGFLDVVRGGTKVTGILPCITRGTHLVRKGTFKLTRK